MKNNFQLSAFSFQKYVQRVRMRSSHFLKADSRQLTAGMTLIETLVAITILAVSIVAPMSLTMQSLSAAYYARDHVIMANLAQEAIEAVRAVRDANILILAINSNATCAADGLPMHLLCNIPVGQDFTIDVRTDPPTISTANTSSVLETDGNVYGYGLGQSTPFRRTIHSESIPGTDNNEISVVVMVERTNTLRPGPAVVIQENLYRWIGPRLR